MSNNNNNNDGGKKKEDRSFTDIMSYWNIKDTKKSGNNGQSSQQQQQQPQQQQNVNNNNGVKSNHDDTDHPVVSLEKKIDLTNHPIVSLIKSSVGDEQLINQIQEVEVKEEEKVVNQGGQIDSVTGYTFISDNELTISNSNNNTVTSNNSGATYNISTSSYVVGESDIGSDGYENKTSTLSSSNYSVSYNCTSESSYTNTYGTSSSGYADSYSIGYNSTQATDDDTLNDHNTPSISIFENNNNIYTSTSGGQDEEESGWNNKFQALLDLPDSQEKFRQISNVANEFVYCANTFGKIIISEKNLPDDSKTILPLQLGGIAGGSKYKCHDIIFKFVADTEVAEGIWMYGDKSRSDEKAQKSASHELKGLNHYMEHSVNGEGRNIIRFPLMAIIDYCGYRLLAISSLPISKSTIVYGSCDGGQNVLNSDPIIDAEMRRMGDIMKLKGHLVGFEPKTPVLLHSPGDIEVHKGFDGRYYMIDFARTFPPEYPALIKGKIGREIFYAMLRPELVYQSEIPLCSDAFSGWQNKKEDQESNQEVIEATEHLHNVIIPELVEFIENNAISPDSNTSGNNSVLKVECTSVSTDKDYCKRTNDIKTILNYIHSKGVNIRYLGIICSKLQQGILRTTYFTEIISRVWKKIIRAQLRDKMEKTKRPSDEPKQLIAYIFDILLNVSKSEDYTAFWSTMAPGGIKYASLKAFPHCLNSNERLDNFDLRQSFDTRLLVVRLIEMLNVRIHGPAYTQFLNDSRYVIGVRDIESVESTVKYPIIIDFASGSMLLYEATKSSNTIHTHKEATRWINSSEDKLKLALSSMPLSERLLLKLANTYLLKTNITVNRRDSTNYLNTAIGTLSIATSHQSERNNKELVALWAIIHLRLAMNFVHSVHSERWSSNLVVTIDKLQESLLLDPTHFYLDKYLSQILPSLSAPTSTSSNIKTTKQLDLGYQDILNLYTLVLIYEQCEESSPIRTYLPQVFSRVKVIKRLHIPNFLNTYITQESINTLLYQSNSCESLTLACTLTNGMGLAITNMKNLTELELYNAYFHDVASSTSTNENDIKSMNQFLQRLFKDCKQLTRLGISMALEDKDFKDIPPLFTALTSLSINRCDFTNETYLEISKYVSNIEQLDLSLERGKPDILNGMERVLLNTVGKLKLLTLYGSSLSVDPLKDALVKLFPDLEYIDLSYTKISNAVLTELMGHVNQAKYINLNSTPVNCESLGKLLESHNPKELKTIKIQECWMDSNEDPFSIISKMDCSLTSLQLPQVKDLYLKYTTFMDMFSKMNSLKHLSFPHHLYLPGFMESYTDYIISNNISGKLPLNTLVSLDMVQVTTSMKSLVKCLELSPQLVSLSLSACTFVTDEGYVIELNDDILDSIIPIIYNITDLDISNHNIDKRHVEKILKGCPNLLSLSCLNCKGLTGQIIYDLSIEYPHIKFSSSFF